MSSYKIGLAFDDFCVEQLENKLSMEEALHIPDDETDETFWVCLHRYRF
jgi:hypothetical protein